ncbi:GTPase ObgE [Paenibacillus larvae]|uniref:GTPase Obg n=1 Tax=Paenibacillus larvae subsp. larvae DSM 25430 TaxID=697284 RepID=V9WBU8_9BACL|nr:GTPase ObgE [Paenibacillus larvae]AHD06597.1 GTPase Obg [Paenibacillus larvae subsp. larvae DSM 25430]AVG13156.1 GTPase Obg [Paenibacillus larvae subsp. larvae DSM 25430]MDR5568850.1 GTPase ObgE [Paenibacillus larvae]MDR5596875.1 GTPase ObgE [Paenibacillus larvae]
MFIDKAKIYVKGGDGGDGLIAFRREKYVPEGGPAGGDGGNGGNVIFRVDEGLRTLVDFRYQKHFKAQRGEKGRNKAQHGANAEHMIVRVPPGTVVIDDDTMEVIADLTRHGQEVIVAKGGRGGRGNMRFATPKNSEPEIAENGEEGQERWVVLELKVMADVGLVGFPSVGKSTLLSIVSGARPKIGAYHFTTLTPNLGVVDVGDGRSFVMADLPGLIQGAHEGVGLGHEFLRHVERTRVIAHVLDMAATEGRDPYDDYQKINDELKLYNAKLEERPQIVVANKMDMPEAEEHLEQFKANLSKAGDEVEIVPISAVSRSGVQVLMYKIADLLETIPETALVEEIKEVEERKVYRLEKKDEKDFTIRRENDTFVVESESLEKLIRRTNFSSQEGVLRFARILRNMGLDHELRKRGAVDGMTIRINDYEFEFVEHE